MKKRSWISCLMAIMMVITGSAIFTSCGDDVGVISDGKTVNIMMVSAGYGTKFVSDTAEKFEELYSEQGYKVNLLPARNNFSGSSALSEMRLGKTTGYDLVITEGVSVLQATDESFGVCVETLDDVYDSYTINFDGSEGTKKISELYDKNQDWRYKIGNTYYGIPYVSSSRGIVCNTRILNAYGITELPVTTNELFSDFDIIYNGANGKTGMRPVTWGGDNAYGYALPTLYTTIAQFMGMEAYDEFFKLNYLLDDSGKINKEGYKHVDNEAIKKAIEVVIHEFDTAYSTTGSITQNHIAAGGQIVTGKAAFMFNGEYFFNEVKTSFPSYLNDIRFVAIPLASQLGVDLKLDGSGVDEAKCDKILSFMAKKVDEGKTATEIKTLTESQFSITLTDAQINKVIEARHIGNGGDTPMYVIKDSPNADIAKLFIRMLLSEDASKIYAKYGMISPLYSSEDVETDYQFIKDAFKIHGVYNYLTNSALYPNSVRAKTNLFLIPPYDAKFVVNVKDLMGSVSKPSQRDYNAFASQIFSTVTKNVKDNWPTLMANGGYSIAD